MGCPFFVAVSVCLCSRLVKCADPNTPGDTQLHPALLSSVSRQQQARGAAEMYPAKGKNSGGHLGELWSHCWNSDVYVFPEQGPENKP